MSRFYIDLRNSETGEIVKYHDKKTFVEDFYEFFEDEYSEGDNAMLIAKRAGFNVSDEAIEIQSEFTRLMIWSNIVGYYFGDWVVENCIEED